MWAPDGNKIATDSLGTLAPEEVLFEFEEPLTFVCRDRDGQMLLAHSLSDAEGLSRYLLCVTDSRIVAELESGRLDLLGALRQPRCWIADFGPAWDVRQLWLIPFDKLPKNVLPKSGSMLTPELNPLFRIRLIGSGVGLGKTKASDIRMAVQAAESGLRGLARIALDETKKVGQMPRDVRVFSDLTYQYSRAASFEVAFGRPRDRLPGVDDEVFEEMGRLFDQGLKALRADAEEPAPVAGLDPDQEAQLFEAIKALTPPTRGGVDRVEVSGGLLDQVAGSKFLTRDDRVRSVQRIKSLKKAPLAEDPFRVSGKVDEADKGKLTFILRHIAPPGYRGMLEIPFWFRESLYDDVIEAFNSPEHVVIVGEKMQSGFEAIQLRWMEDTSPE